jgi:hypothetical protein
LAGAAPFSEDPFVSDDPFVCIPGGVSPCELAEAVERAMSSLRNSKAVAAEAVHCFLVGSLVIFLVTSIRTP